MKLMRETPEASPTYWRMGSYDRDERFRCTAWNKRTGERCKNPRVTDTDVCRKHGGVSFWTQHRFLTRKLEEAVVAHLEWLDEQM